MNVGLDVVVHHRMLHKGVLAQGLPVADRLLCVLYGLSHNRVPFAEEARRAVLKLKRGLSDAPALGLLADEVLPGDADAVQRNQALAPLNNQVQVGD